MPDRQRASASVENTEAARAFLQTRIALFWKVMCIILLLGTALAVVGAFKRWGMDTVLDVVGVALTGTMWGVFRRGQRSVRFCRTVDGVAVVAFFILAGFLSRYVLVGFARDHALVTTEGSLMADAYVSALGLCGAGLQLAIRAALVPSSPRRTIVYTTMVGVPLLSAYIFLVPNDGGLAIRPAASGAYPWLTIGCVMMWGFVTFANAVISKVIYGLRAEVREARQLGQYVLEQKIGEGGMGEVYRARHGMMRRPSALKLLRADRAREGSVVRFEREVQLTARLTHANTITIFDYGRTDDGVFYYAMELLDGANLQRIVDVGGPQAAGRVVRILGMACGALTEAHAIGLIHRDIKPANIMLCTQGGERDVVKLLDFGLVKELEVDGDAKLSGASTLTGSPQYMAPEAIVAPDSVDVRTDIYALGAVAYYLLAGGDLFTGKSIVEVCSQHLHQPPQPFASRGVAISADLEAVVLACLEKDPARRPQSAAELRSRLEACAVDPWDHASARSWWLDHQAKLDNGATRSSGETRTIAVHGLPRSATAVVG